MIPPKMYWIMILSGIGLFIPTVDASWAASTARVNVSSDGIVAEVEPSAAPRITPSGRFVVFETEASNLVTPTVPGDGNTVKDVFVHDRDVSNDGTLDQAGDIKTVRANVKTDGTEATGGGSANARITDSGRFVVFESAATNISATTDTNGVVDIFLHDRDVGNDGAFDVAGDIETFRVNVRTDGTIAAGGASNNPVISNSGRFVAFQSIAANLVTPTTPGDTNGVIDIFVHDRDVLNDGTFDEVGDIATVRVNVSTGSTQATGGSSTNPDISGDGRFVVFQSDATNLVATDSNGVGDVFIHDRDVDINGTFDEAGLIKTVRVNVASNGTVAAGASSANPSVSDNGRYVAFESGAANLVTGDTNGVVDVFVHDRDTDNDGIFDEVGFIKSIRVSVATDGTEATGGASTQPVISADGRFIAFQSAASNLAVNDLNGLPDIFLHDRDTDADGIFDEVGAVATIRVNVNTVGVPATGGASAAPDVSNDGRFIAFLSLAANLVGLDINGVDDIFVRDRQTAGGGGGGGTTTSTGGGCFITALFPE